MPLSVEKVLLRKCCLFGREWEYSEFVEWFKSLPTPEKEWVIFSVGTTYGFNSEQFYFVVQAFVLWVILRHNCVFEADVFNDAVLAIVEKVRFFDARKGNLMSFLYSLIRDRVSKKKYDDEKAGSIVSLEECRDLGYGGASNVDVVGVDDALRKKLRSEVWKVVNSGVDSVYRRFVLWHVVAEALGGLV